MPDTLLDLDRAGIEVHVLPYQTEHLRNSRAGGDAGFDDQLYRFFQADEDPGSLVEREDPALVLVALLSELRLAGRAALPFLPQTVSFGVVEDAAHDRANAVHGPP